MQTNDARDLLLLSLAASLDALLANRRQNPHLQATRDALMRASFDFAESLKSRIEAEAGLPVSVRPAA